MGCCFRGHSFLLSPSYPHSVSPSRVPGVVLSAGARAECAAKRGHRHLPSFPKSVSAPDRRAGVRGRTGGSVPIHWPRASVTPSSCPKVARSQEVTHGLASQTFCGLMANKGWASSIMVGKRWAPWRECSAQMCVSSLGHGGEKWALDSLGTRLEVRGQTQGRQAGRHFIAFDFFSPDNYNHQAKAQAAQINVCPIQFWEHCAHIHRSSFFENLK